MSVSEWFRVSVLSLCATALLACSGPRDITDRQPSSPVETPMPDDGAEPDAPSVDEPDDGQPVPPTSQTSPEWLGAWSAAPYGPYPLKPLTALGGDVATPLPSVLINNRASNQSFRMIVQPTLGDGERLRVRLSNLMGEQPVRFESVHVARSLAQNTPAIEAASNTPLYFDGESGVTVAPGAEAVSDAVPFVYQTGDHLAVSFHVSGQSGAITWHAISYGLNYLTLPGMGDVTGDISGASFTQHSMGWFFLSGIDIKRSGSPGSIVALGDSITDGAFTLFNSRWTDHLADRLAAAAIPMGVMNQGINSNTVTAEATTEAQAFKGAPAVLRFDRDVLQRAGVRSVVIFEGTNDLTAGQSAEQIFAGIRSLVARAHEAGLCVVVGTLTPRADVLYNWDAQTMEPQRQRLNALIRAQDDVEGIADFDLALGRASDPTKPALGLYSLDLLHPNAQGMKAIAEAVPLDALAPPPFGNCAR